MKANVRLRTALLLTPLFAALLYIALNWYALVDEETRIGARREAIENPYLAYTRLLDRMGVRAKLVREPDELRALPAGGTLLIGPHRLVYMTPQRQRALLDWTRAGGHLVVAAEAPAVSDPILDALGVARRTDAPPDPKAAVLIARQSNTPTVFDWPGESRALRVKLSPFVELRDTRTRPDAVVAKNAGSVGILRFPEGAGTVTVLASLNFLANGSIGQDDAARFGWKLATDAGESAPAVLFLGVHAEPLLEWLRRVAMPVVISAALLLALWLARIIPRFGPLAPEPPPVRRSLLEHVVAAGRFLWSRGERDFLLDAARERAWQSARRRGIPRDAAALARAVSLLAASAGMGEADVRTALVEPATDARGFVAAIARLHDLESRLARGTPLHRA